MSGAVPALLAMPVTSRPEAEAFIDALVVARLDYHFDDGAVDCLAGNGHVTREAAGLIDEQVQRCYAAFEAAGADMSEDCPIGHMIGAIERRDGDAWPSQTSPAWLAALYLAPRYMEVPNPTYLKYRALPTNTVRVLEGPQRIMSGLAFVAGARGAEPMAGDEIFMGVTGRLDGFTADRRYFVLAES